MQKNNHDIAYHFVQEVVARKEWFKGYVKSENNYPNPLPKTFPEGERRDRLVGHYLYKM